MEFRILGPLEVIGHDGAVRLGGVKQRTLLTVLLLHANQSVSPERLALALWGEDAPSGAVKAVQVHVSRLRKAIGEEEVLLTTPVGYQLFVRPGELDAERFEQLAEHGRLALEEGRAEHAAAVLRDALSLWRGPPLEDVAYEPFAQEEIAALEEQRLAALNLRIEADLAAGRHGEVLGELQRFIGVSPKSEPLARQLMLALYRCGRQREALEVYTGIRTRLSRDLGLEPGPALQALQRDILEQASSLDPPTPAAADVGESRQPFPLPAALAANTEGTFVGRASDVDALADVYAEVTNGDGRLAMLCGEPGIGKTRLAAEFARRAHQEGAIVLYGRCDEEGLLALQPFVEALRHYVSNCPAGELARRLGHVGGELRRILPELADRVAGLAQPLPGDPEGARSRLFAAVAGLICDAAVETPVVLVLDDLHWADRATLLLLKYLVRHPCQGQLMVLGTYRETELDSEHPLRTTLAALGREHDLRRYALAPLDAVAVHELVGIHAGEDTSYELRRMVYEGTEGNAFFVVEVLRHLAESGAIGEARSGRHPGAAVGLLSVPEGVKDVISQRVRRAGQQADRLLAIASVLGRDFELQVLERLSGLAEDELLDVLDAAVRAHVIDEVAGCAGRYTFSHALIRETLYGALSAARRALVHRRAGAALEAAHSGDLEPHLAELAYHFARAGSRADLDKAIEYGSRAGAHATSRLAYEQAATHFRQTVELIDAADRGGLQQQRRCDLVIAQGEAERRAGDPAYGRTLLEGARLAQELGDPGRLARAALATNRGLNSSAYGIDLERVTTLKAALDAYDPADSPTRAALLATLAQELAMAGDSGMRDRLRDDALAMARRVGDPRTLAHVLTQRAIPQWSSQTAAERRSNLHEALELADGLNDPLLAGHAAYMGAHAAMNRGDLEEADRLLARLSTVAEQLAQPFMRWYDAVARAKRCVISGPAEEAERLAFAALKIGRRGRNPDSELYFLGQLFAARFLQDALDRTDPYLPELVERPGSSLPTGAGITPSRSLQLMIGAGMSLILCEVGRFEHAREHFELLMSEGLENLPPDAMALALVVFASVACAHLGDTPAAVRLSEMLEPHSDLLVTMGSSWFGATTHYLGLLAATRGRFDEADARFAEAERTYVSLGAKPWLARLGRDRAAAPLSNGRGRAASRI